MAPFPQIRLMDEPIHAITEVQAVKFIIDSLEAGHGGWVATHNLDHLRRLVANPDFSTLCSTASLRTADGKPLIWAARLQGTPLPERVAGSDMVLSLTAAAAGAGRSIFLLGGNEGVAPRAADALVARYPGLRIAGTYCPPMGYDRDPAEMQRITETLAAARPDIVYVAVGSPKQEKLIEHLTPVLPGAWFLGIGISLSFITGDVRRAPPWMQRSGLEWVHRLWQEPGRLARRYLIEGVPFCARLLWRSFSHRFSH
jgi:N-acetylglucosaminyldiphosphoundecaprenol N-acetyl-beta-D-mannosaminyltransferase